MSSYKIERIDPILRDNSITKIPIIYIKPDTSLLQFIKANNNSVICEITGTNQYNGTISGTVQKSCNVLGYRPNYFAETNYYVIILDLSWHGYPKSLGTVVFKGLHGPLTQKQYDEAKKPEDQILNSGSSVIYFGKTWKTLFSKTGIISMIFILVVLLVLMISCKLKKK